MNPSILLVPLGNIVGLSGLFNLDVATSFGVGKLNLNLLNFV